ncbi:MAG TPA: hypothetical protein VFO29_11910 [Candidatus Rubrimentiphilum sp.]|nr:hypothetical protein [Candidatus Rubrimentiphilum sp.]
MIRLLLLVATLIGIHVGFKALWDAWLPALSDPHPMLFNVTYGAFFSQINHVLVAPMLTAYLDITSRSPIWHDQVATFAKWIIGG